ncbi:TetR/AcrR family transcriptional regulator [Nocardiopsis changdeensis]|uniref:TetR family transcriptional regulator n=1 Tax=Nocardiopsis changdeensis TaxID=2831969 RepID=A0ABX8BJC9_9ACTN|nr:MULTISPECIES: TetR/AcrR family transcriptional regulator [Nocardiopsis]QUX20513.1 TetR family transcriptional regulator [Nocardiopsis changdeensis]QYX36444.1 TetR/AcrR family transcriptional regulator [Nocardiopsis sp. MT53]
MDGRTHTRRRNRAAIQEAALRLFAEQGYEATTVAQIAREAGVSHMTFFRCFPTKEDVVLDDDYDPMLEELVRARPAAEPPVERVHRATMAGLGQVYEHNREALLGRVGLLLSIPGLRARIGENLASARTAFERGLTPEGREPDMETRAVAAACASALAEAVIAWSEAHERVELPDVIDRVFHALRGLPAPEQGTRP